MEIIVVYRGFSSFDIMKIFTRGWPFDKSTYAGCEYVGYINIRIVVSLYCLMY